MALFVRNHSAWDKSINSQSNALEPKVAALSSEEEAEENDELWLCLWFSLSLQNEVWVRIASRTDGRHHRYFILLVDNRRVADGDRQMKWMAGLPPPKQHSYRIPMGENVQLSNHPKIVWIPVRFS